MIQFINQFAPDEEFDFAKRIELLRARKLEQTQEKVEKEGGLDEDDYGRVVAPDDFNFEFTPNHEDGSFYGYSGWSENYARLLKVHPLYVDPLDAFVGRGFFFITRRKGSLWNPDYRYDHLKPELEKYNIIPGIGSDGHFTPDLQIGFTLGWGGILRKLREYREQNGCECHEFYDAEIRIVTAIIDFLNRIADELEAFSRIERNSYLQGNLAEMARINKKLAAEAPETMREVCQWMCWFSFFSRLYNRGPSGGQLDQMLLPYYERDRANGILSEDEARFYIACLLLNDSRYYQLGGPDETGADLTNHLSYLIMEAADWMNIPCNLTVRVHDRLNRNFLVKAVDYLFKNRNGWPRFSGDKSLVRGFMKCGFSQELARRRLAGGCHWMSLPGLEYTLNDLVKINAAKVFEVAYYEMMDDPSASSSVVNLWNHFIQHLERAVAVTAEGIAFHLKYQVYNEPELILNLFSHGPVEEGVDVTQCSRTYFNLCIDGAGIATVADSFAALEQRVEREKRITYSQLTRQLYLNYEDIDGEFVRQMMLHSERYGQGDSLGDKWGIRISQAFAELVRKQNAVHPGLNYIPGWFSWSNTLEFGSRVRATPNGRKNGEAISHGANPTAGFRRDGAVTALANTIAAIQPGYGNTAPVQLELDPGLAKNEESVLKMASMVRAILETGNTLLNINIIDEQKILEAHRDPSRYPDLVVRVTGFTAYFAMLSPEFRQLVVDRIIAK
jgi:pyruvate-formate lyase